MAIDRLEYRLREAKHEADARRISIEISSSEIRGRVQAGLSIDGLVSPTVAEAIHNNRLYLSK